MGFRNPLTTLSASQITPGTLLGSVIATAAAGKRVKITSDPTNRAEFYTGDVDEDAAGYIDVGINALGAPGDDRPYLCFEPPGFDAITGNRVTLMGRPRSGLGGGYLEVITAAINLHAQLNLVGGADFSGPVSIAGLTPDRARGSRGVYSGATVNGDVVCAQFFPATPTDTRVSWVVNGHAGYGDGAAVMLLPELSPPCTVLSTSGPQVMPVAAGTWISVSEGGAFLIPADTAVTLTLRAYVPTAGAEYWRTNFDWNRTYE